MKQITGRYATAIVYTDIIEETATEQIRQLCDQSFVEGCSIRIMPDVHAGTGCVIGFIADLGHLGRECTDEQDRIHMAEQIQLCREFTKESDCYEAPFPFPSAHTQYSYLTGKNIAPDVELYDDSWGEVILMSGLPGTGKDT